MPGTDSATPDGHELRAFAMVNEAGDRFHQVICETCHAHSPYLAEAPWIEEGVRWHEQFAATAPKVRLCPCCSEVLRQLP